MGDRGQKEQQEESSENDESCYSERVVKEGFSEEIIKDPRPRWSERGAMRAPNTFYQKLLLIAIGARAASTMLKLY